jgi:hypothetical protein
MGGSVEALAFSEAKEETDIQNTALRKEDDGGPPEQAHTLSGNWSR